MRDMLNTLNAFLCCCLILPGTIAMLPINPSRECVCNLGDRQLLRDR